MRSRRLSAAVVVVAAVLPLSACSEIEAEEEKGYEPSTLTEVKGSEDLKRVTFTPEGAARTGLKTAEVVKRGRHTVVPYASVIYTEDGGTWAYTSPEPLTFLRVAIQVARVEGDRALLTKGPPVGTKVVTTGAIEVYGTEFEVGN
jgi:hypothetical protein